MNIIIIGDVSDCVWWRLYSGYEQVGNRWWGWIIWIRWHDVYTYPLSILWTINICWTYSRPCLFCCGACAPLKYIYLSRGVTAFELEDDVGLFSYFISFFPGFLEGSLLYVTLRTNCHVDVMFSFEIFWISSLSFGVETFMLNFMFLFCCTNSSYVCWRLCFGEVRVISYMLNYFIKYWVGN